MAIVSPIGFVRNAVKAQFVDPVKGLNANLVTYCGVYGAPVWSFSFATGSRNFFEAFVDYPDSEDTDIPQKNMLTLFGGGFTPFGDNDGRRMMGVAFSGMVDICAEMYIGVLGERIQKFDAYVDAATAAMLATMNDVNNQGTLNAADSATRSGKVYAMDLGARTGRVQLDGENWIIPMRFTMSFGVVIP